VRRREFIAGSGVIVVTATAGRPLCADAQSPTSKRIAIVSPGEKLELMSIKGSRAYVAYFHELNRLGYVEGQNLVVERLTALGQSERHENVARAAIESQPDLIICIGTALALRLKSLTTTIPIVATSADPVALGLITNLARPEGNITGASADAGIGLWGKRLQFLREVVGTRLRNVRCLFSATAIAWEASAPSLREAAQRVGASISAELLSGNVDQAAYERVFDLMDREQVDGLVIYDAPEHVYNRLFIVDLAAKHRLPTIYPYREFVEVGGLFSYGIDVADLMRRLAVTTDQILKGARPGDIPFFKPTKFDLVLNRTTVKSLGLEFPADMLSVADEVIE
jgi:putative ABC transport system substrate-binding protein